MTKDRLDTTPQLERLGAHCERLRLHRVGLELSALLEQAAKRDLGYADFPDEVLRLEIRSKHEKHLAMRVSMARFPFQKSLELFDWKFHPFKVDPPPRPTREPHVHLAEGELGEFAGDPLEAHQDFGRQRLTGGADHPIGRREPEPVARLAQLAPDLAGGQRRVGLQPPPHERWNGRVQAGAPHLPSTARGHVIDLPGHRNPLLARDAPHRPERGADLLGHVARRHLGAQQLLHEMTIQHPEHPPRASNSGDHCPPGMRL
ncbi:MAG TPA: ATP-binding protein [Gemmatimonadaceae bacterium]